MYSNMMNQPGMVTGMPMMQTGMGMQGMMMSGMMLGIQPIYKQIAVGNGIDMNEYNRIVGVATSVYMMKQIPLSTNTANGIKMQLGGEWLVVCYPATKMYDFCLSTVKGGDYMSFSLDNTLFQVCRLKN